MKTEFKKSPLLPVVITVVLYVVFFDKISLKPTDAGFWFILAMGMSFGVALSKYFMRFKSKTDD